MELTAEEVAASDRKVEEKVAAEAEKVSGDRAMAERESTEATGAEPVSADRAGRSAS